MADRDIVIKALRCSIECDQSKKMKCEECEYRLLEEVNDEIPCPCDVEINGIKYWQSCDCDRICSEAASMLERDAEIQRRTIQELIHLIWGEGIPIDILDRAVKKFSGEW